jgi:gamma-glutamylcyclotransferase (GGCT)/AIG2-like uncharacterized protein YtfP
VRQPADPFLLFVYGTLQRGGVRHGPLARQRFLGEYRTRPRYALYDLGTYPGLVASDEGQVVAGELYEVERSLLVYLDGVEGAPSWFALGPIDLEESPGQAWAYFYQQNPVDRPRIASGKWYNPPSEERDEE